VGFSDACESAACVDDLFEHAVIAMSAADAAISFF
jgi:hypothetical protein